MAEMILGSMTIIWVAAIIVFIVIEIFTQGLACLPFIPSASHKANLPKTSSKKYIRISCAFYNLILAFLRSSTSKKRCIFEFSTQFF